MKNVVLITNIPSPYRVDLFYYMQTHRKEYTIHVIYTSRGEDNRQWDVQQEKLINSHFCESKVLKVRGKLDNRYIHIPGNIGKVLNQINPAAVVAMEYNPAAIQSMVWCKLHRKKFIHWTDGTLHSERNINAVQKLTRKIICSNADACIASSTKAKEKLLAWGVPERKIFISLLTVDISQYQQVERTPIPGRILYVGRITNGKGLELLLEALRIVKTDYQLRIVGDGDPQMVQTLKKMAVENRQEEKVSFLGYKQGKDLLDEYASAQAFVLPTKDDCFGLVLLEAVCMGIPVISSKYADGAYDVILAGENGMIVDPFDAKEFAQAIEAVISEDMCIAGSKAEHIDKFHFAQVVCGYLSAINYALSI